MCFFFNDTATTEIYTYGHTLSLHDALPICSRAPPSPAGVSDMMNLREYRNTADRLADHLPWAALIAPGVVLSKDGSFKRSLRFLGPDLDSEIGRASCREGVSKYVCISVGAVELERQ